MRQDRPAGDEGGVWRYLGAQWRRAFGLNVSLIDPQLFVGGQFHPEQWPALRALGVRAVLSLQEEAEDRFLGAPPERALRLLVPDFEPPEIAQLRDAVQFIGEAQRDGLPVMVHCHAGVGRAPLAAAAYLMAVRQLSHYDALALLRRRRPIIGLNERQLARLLEWGELLRAEGASGSM
jgi:predicted protein tyrosine phosphatase